LIRHALRVTLRPPRGNTGSTETDYQLGHDPEELARLEYQGRILAPATRTLLEAAGLREGMRVLDLGSGLGDVSFVVADIVGAAGEVVGVELMGDIAARATRRAEEAGRRNVRFLQGDIRTPAPAGPFDAITCRLVLMYLEDPAAVLRTQAEQLVPGGIVAPTEFDLSAATTSPPTPLVAQTLQWVHQGLARAGADTSLGPKLWQVLTDAGLEPQGMLGVHSCFGPSDPAASVLLASVVRTVMPHIERFGNATAAEVGVDTLQDRIATEINAAQAVWTHPTLYTAWATRT
jgi:ubiquinone/menaquinone biosynthesis C-methylase UbiE